MTQSTKERVFTGIIVGVMMILIQATFSAFKGRWAKGSEFNDFVREKEYIENREIDLNKAYIYADDKVESFGENHSKEHVNYQLQIDQIKTVQDIQIDNINKNIGEILKRLP